MRPLVLAAFVACTAHPPVVEPTRFANAPAVAAVDDRRDVPAAPSVRTNVQQLYAFDGAFLRPITNTLELPVARRALGVNALDEVPDSTWFTNRIGVRDVAPEELRDPPGFGSPEAHTPWTIESTKAGGVNVGFVIKDARGVRYLLKFDQHALPEAETAAEVIISRLLWAAGYNVPENYVAYFRREDLVLSPDAVIKDVFGNASQLTFGEIDRRLAKVVIGDDGRIRALASRIIDGTLIGGHPQRGVRHDDPNDRIPHELRRDLRGLQAIYAWLDNVDVKEDNTLDAWITDPADSTRHYVKHYLIDFGKGLGVSSRYVYDRRRSFEYTLDWGALFDSLFLLGAYRRPWEHRDMPDYRGIGLYDAAAFDPVAWKPSLPAYLPFVTSDRIDRLWAAKLIARFTRDQLRAAVEAAKLTDPRAAAYILDTLIARQRATASVWFARTSPLDRFGVGANAELCFDDLALVHQLAKRETTEYVVAVFDRAGKPTRDPVRLRATAASSCTLPLPLAGYTIVRIDIARPAPIPPVFVHLDRDPVKRLARVIGVWRR